MSRVIDTLFKTMSQLQDSSDLIEDDEFMMNIFEEYRDLLPPFKKYWDFIFEKKRMSVVARCSKDGSKVVHMARLRKELFSPTNRTNATTKALMHGLAKTAEETVCKELLDPTKTTYQYTSQSNSDKSYGNISAERETLQLGTMATNDVAESTLGRTTANVQRFGRISLSSAAAISTAKSNGFMQQESLPPRKRKSAVNVRSPGMLFGLSTEVQHAIVLAARLDAQTARKANIAATLLQFWPKILHDRRRKSWQRIRVWQMHQKNS